MKVINVLLAVLVVAAVIWLIRPKTIGTGDSGPTYDGASITVRGPGNTLESLAATLTDLGQPDLLRFDPEKNRYICSANLIVEGELQVGRPDGPLTVLEFKTEVCGDKNLRVYPDAELRFYNAEVATVDRTLVGGFCPKGYAVFCEGTIIAHDTAFRFMTGSQSEFLQNEAHAELRRCTFEGGDTASFTTVDLDGRDVDISDCFIRGDGNHGLSVKGPSERPVVFRRCRIAGRVSAVLNQGEADLVLVDCLFPRDMLEFSQPTGTIRVKHTIHFKVLDAEGRPVPDVRVTAASRAGLPIREADGARTGADGTCSIELTEYVARKGAPTREDGVNTATPHRIEVRSADDNVIASPGEVDIANLARIGAPMVIRLAK